MRFERLAARAIKFAYGKFGNDPVSVIPERQWYQWVQSEVGSQVLLIKVKDLFICAFRGSNGWDNLDGIKDWYNDISCRMVPILGAPDGVRVHQGFLRGWDSVKRPVWQSYLDQGSSNMVFCPMGHSYGGGQAQIAGAYAMQAGYRVWQVTEGCPRAWNEEGAQWASRKERMIRFVVPGDPVTMVPCKEPPFFSPWSEQYFHEDGKVELTEKGPMPAIYSTPGRAVHNFWRKLTWPVLGGISLPTIRKDASLHEPAPYENRILDAYPEYPL